MLVFNRKNGKQLILSQTEPDGCVAVNRLPKDGLNTLSIPSEDMVQLINYYKYMKSNDLYCAFINPNGNHTLPKDRYGTWIDASKRLPKTDDPVIVSLNDQDSSPITGVSCCLNGAWELWATAPDNVAFWMPMPVPYTDGNVDNWTTVEEKLPPKNLEVLVCLSDGFINASSHDGKTWALYEDGAAEEGEIVAWKMLPLPNIVF